MDHKIYEIISKVEDSTTFLTCSLDALWLLQEELSANLCLRKKSGEDMGYFIRLSSAMVPALRDLDRIRKDLDAMVDAEYNLKKEW